MWRWWSKHIDIRAFLVFQRMQRFYHTLIVLAALVSGLAVGVLTFPEFHSSAAGLNEVGEGFLCSSAITAVVSAVAATMLLFQFEGFEKASRLDLAVAWVPLTLLDLAIVEFLIGVTCWYCDKNVRWRGDLMATQLVVLFGIFVTLSTWMWFRMSQKGGLGKEEMQLNSARRRVADADNEEELDNTRRMG